GLAGNESVHRLVCLPRLAVVAPENVRAKAGLAVRFPHNFERSKAVFTNTKASPPDAALQPGIEKRSLAGEQLALSRREIRSERRERAHCGLVERSPCPNVIRQHYVLAR